MKQTWRRSRSKLRAHLFRDDAERSLCGLARRALTNEIRELTEHGEPHGEFCSVCGARQFDEFPGLAKGRSPGTRGPVRRGSEPLYRRALRAMRPGSLAEGGAT